MKKILMGMALIFTLAGCGNKKAQQETTSESVSDKDRVEVLYFHGKQRCITCNAIVNLTKEVHDEDFKKQLENGELQFKIIDISTKEGEMTADKYEVTWSSLFIDKWQNGEEKVNNMTDIAFTYAKSSPEVFKAGIKEKIEELLD